MTRKSKWNLKWQTYQSVRGTGLYFRKILLDERGVSQIIVYLGCLICGFFFFLFCVQAVLYMITVMEVNDVADTILKDGMKVNNGLTPALQTIVMNSLAAKGFDPARVVINGSISPQTFGEIMQGSITYTYHLTIFNSVGTLIPGITVQDVDITSATAPVALGIIR